MGYSLLCSHVPSSQAGAARRAATNRRQGRLDRIVLPTGEEERSCKKKERIPRRTGCTRQSLGQECAAVAGAGKSEGLVTNSGTG